MSTATIVFDGAILAGAHPTGVARSFLDTLAAYRERTDDRLILLLPPGAEDPEFPGVEPEPWSGHPLTRHLHGGRRLRQLGAQVFHTPVAALPRALPCPAVATLHDLPWTVPGLRGEPGQNYRHWRAAHRALHSAARVLVPSEFTRSQIQRWGRPDSRVQVLPHGLPAVEGKATAPDARTGPLLAFGDFRPRKNLARLRRSWHRARERHPDLPDLRICGPGEDWVSESEKHDLLQDCSALVQVSLTEGFGLPMLEAFRAGAPVLAADRGSLPELAAGAAALVDPEDEAAIASAIVRIAGDRELRTELHRRGVERVRDFPIQATAEGWLRVHRCIRTAASGS